MPKSCSVTGHRDIPTGRIEYVKDELRNQILLAIKDGFTHFISGMAEGVDLYFAAIIVEIKLDNPSITLEAAIPHRKRLDTKDKTFQRLIKLCDSVHVTAETFSKGSYLNRNMYMVQQSERVIAVYDGRDDGGTAFTVRYAGTKDREIRIIEVK